MDVYGCNRVKGCSLLGQEPAAHTFKRTETWKFATNSKTYKTILHTPVPFRWNHILLVLSLVTQFCTNNSYSLNGNTLHYWLSYYEDYRHFEGILSLLSQSFELYVIVLHNIFTRDLWKTLKITKMTLIIKDNLSPIYQFSCSIHLLSFDHVNFCFAYA